MTAARATPRRRHGAAAGLLAAALALAAGELVDAVSEPAPSLVTVVGQAFIRGAPARVGRAAIEAVGTRDKPLLIAGTVVVSLVLGMFVGLVARRRRLAGDLAFAVFGLLAVGCAAGLHEVSVTGTAVAAVLAATVGATGLRLLLGAAPAVAAPGVDGSAVAAPGVDGSAVAGPSEPGGGHAEPGRGRSVAGRGHAEPGAAVLLPGSGATRRRFLSVGTAVGGTTGLVLLGAKSLRQAGFGDTRPVPVRFPAAADPATPLDGAGETFDVEGLSPLVTPPERFFRIDEALVAPAVHAPSWRLRITGMVDNPIELTYDQLLAEPLIERHITMACVSAEVGGPLVGNSRWLGVRLADLLRRAGVQPGATQVVGRSVDGFSAGFPTEVALDGRDAMVAVAMEGRPLTRIHGYPARLVVPGLYGYLSATKWLREIELTTWEAFDAYWVARGWADRGPVKVQSRVDVPRGYSRVAAGRRPLAGVAWAPTRGIAGVEVKVDDGPWQQARLGLSIGDDAWRQWTSEWTATHGHHVIAVRATTNDGELQTAEKRAAFPNGASGRHQVEVWVPD